MEKDKIQSNDEIGNENVEQVNIEPAALSDADLDNVAGGNSFSNLTIATNSSAPPPFFKTMYTLK